MPNSATMDSEEQRFLISHLPPSAAQKRLALGIVVGLATALYLVTGPLGGMQLGALHAFVPIYVTASFVTDSITAVLLFAQFSILRSRAVLVIASGYLFAALMILQYTAAFPGVLSPHGLIGGLQTAAGFYLLWHCGFPLFVLGYALLKDEDAGNRISQGKGRLAILLSVAGTATMAALAGLLCTKGQALLPRIMLDESRFTPEWPYVVGLPVCAACICALAVLWFRRRSILDLFLIVVLFAYLIEIPPHYYPVPSRFSIGWYAVRVTSILSSSIVLIVLLYEISALYGALLGAVLGQRREREARLITGNAVAAAIAHEVRQPLTAMITSADAGARFLDRTMPNLEKAREAFKHISADGLRAGEVITSIRATFRNDVRNRSLLDFNDIIAEAIALERGALRKYQIQVHAESTARLPEVRGDRVQLKQVLLNLITNAIDAMATRDEPRILRVKSEAYGDDGVAVSVADTGMGVGAQDMDRIFNPLFTTKTEGMGMGLAICRSIIEAHEGRLWVAPNTPRGAVFQFTLQAKNSVSAGA